MSTFCVFAQFVWILALIPVVGCAHKKAPLKLTIMGTTDIHGYYGVPEDPKKPGGLARLAAAVDRERASGRQVLLVDSGDMWSGTMLSDRNQGELGVTAFNALGYAAAALGNHEFDYGPKGKSTKQDPFSVLKKRLAQASFPVLAANLRDRRTGQFPAWTNLAPSTIVRRGQWRIGIIGAITDTTPTITFPFVGKHLKFLHPLEPIREEARKLKKQGVDLTIVIAHIGGHCRRTNDPRDLSSCMLRSHSFELARGLDSSLVQAIFGGHSHRQTAHWVNGIAVMQAGRYGQSVVAVEVELRQKSPVKIDIRSPKKLVGSSDSVTARAISKLLAPYEARVRTLRAEKLGARIAERLGVDRRDSSPLGTFLCDVLLQLYPDRQICLLNSGGLRKAFEQGPLTYGALYDTMPFGNHSAFLDIPGSLLKKIIRVGTSGAHGVLQVAGLKVRYDLGRDLCPSVDRDGDGKIDGHDRDRLLSVTLASGAPIEDDKEYRIVTSSFLAKGGDGLVATLKGLHPKRVRILYDRPVTRDALAAHFRQVRPLVNSKDKPVMDKKRVQGRGVFSRKSCKK